MKANELMIGDWVYILHGGKATHYGKVTALLPSGAIESEIDGSHALSSSVEPIPITPEILKKNGFTYCKSDGGFYLHTTISYGNWDVDVVLFDVTDEYRNNQLHISSPDDSYIAIHLMECNHVHELQHALRLCGIEKEISLC